MQNSLTQAEAIDTYVKRQKTWITRLYARRQIQLVKHCSSWIANKDVLDIGCGLGVLGAAFGDLAKSFKLCDMNDINCFGLEVTVCSAEKLPYESGSFDTAFMLGVIEHVNQPKLAINETQRVLRGGGKLILSIPHGTGWWLMRLVEGYLPANLQEHAHFNQKHLYQLMDGWKLLRRRPIIYGLFWMYEFESIK